MLELLPWLHHGAPLPLLWGRGACMSLWKAVRSQALTVLRMLMFFDLQIPFLEFRTEEIIRNSENAQRCSQQSYL